jgi:hypothetical protein
MTDVPGSSRTWWRTHCLSPRGQEPFFRELASCKQRAVRLFLRSCHGAGGDGRSPHRGAGLLAHGVPSSVSSHGSAGSDGASFSLRSAAVAAAASLWCRHLACLWCGHPCLRPGKSAGWQPAPQVGSSNAESIYFDAPMRFRSKAASPPFASGSAVLAAA